MKVLSNIVSQSLEKQNLKCEVFHPHELNFIGTDSDFEADQIKLKEILTNDSISLIHGDVVQDVEPKKFGILSGDDIAAKFMKEAKKLKIYRNLHMIFAMTDAPGVMTLPPDEPDVSNIQSNNTCSRSKSETYF